MCRELIGVLNELVLGIQGLPVMEVIDPVNFPTDDYLLGVHDRAIKLVRENVFKSRYAFNVRTIELLHVVGYAITVDDNFNVIVLTCAGKIIVLNPLQISTET